MFPGLFYYTTTFPKVTEEYKRLAYIERRERREKARNAPGQWVEHDGPDPATVTKALATVAQRQQGWGWGNEEDPLYNDDFGGRGYGGRDAARGDRYEDPVGDPDGWGRGEQYGDGRGQSGDEDPYPLDDRYLDQDQEGHAHVKHNPFPHDGVDDEEDPFGDDGHGYGGRGDNFYEDESWRRGANGPDNMVPAY